MKSLALLVLLLATPARAETVSVAEAPAFGRAGQWVLQPSTGFSFFSTRMAIEDSALDTRSVGGGLGVDRFFTDQLTLGMALSYGRSTSTSRSSGDQMSFESRGWNGSLGLTAGWHRPLGSWASFWPQAQGFVGLARQTIRSLAEGDPAEEISESWSAGVELTAAVVVHPVRHFFFGAGPRLSCALGFEDTTDSRSTQVSLGPLFTLGGWF